MSLLLCRKGHALLAWGGDLDHPAGLERHALQACPAADGQTWPAEDAKQIIGVGQARNRVQRAVETIVPFGLLVGTLAVCWYATAGHHPDDLQAARRLAPRYRDKAQSS